MQRIIPAILERDPAETERKLRALEGLVDWVQVDIMDGKFVPSVSHAVRDIPDIARKFKLEIHLMVKEPGIYFAECAAVGANRVFFHLRGADSANETLKIMDAYSFEKGIAINPEIPPELLNPFIGKLDAVLLLSVEPGFQGHEFLPSVLSKVPEVRALNPLALIGMDGGIDRENIAKAFGAGVDFVSVGSGIWERENPAEALRKLQEIIQ